MSTMVNNASRAEQVAALGASLPGRASLVARLLHRYAARHANFDLNPASTGILLAIQEQPRHITELAELEGQTQPYVTRLVSDMEGRGWVRRVRDREDGRVVFVHITESGKAAVADTRTVVREMLAAALAELSDEQLDSLTSANQALLLLIDTLKGVVER